MLKNAQTIARQGGFTLIEIIVGIVTLGIVLSLLTVLLFPQAKRSAEPLLQMRAAELGIALMNEATSTYYDELQPGNWESSSITELNLRYPNFTFNVNICLSNEEGACSTAGLFKRIRVSVTTPFNEIIVFSSIKGRYE